MFSSQHEKVFSVKGKITFLLICSKTQLKPSSGINSYIRWSTILDFYYTGLVSVLFVNPV